MDGCIFLSVFDPRIDTPGQIKSLMYEKGFFPGATKEIAFENAIRKFAPSWDMKTFFIPAMSNVSDQEIDNYLNGIDKRGR